MKESSTSIRARRRSPSILAASIIALLAASAPQPIFAAPTPTPPPAAFWRGNVNGVWTTNTAGVTNWATTAAGTTGTVLPPGANTNVTFSTSNVTPGSETNTTLGANITIHSLTIDDANPVGIGGANTLTISGSAGTGITVNSGAGLLTIGANVTFAGTSRVITVNNAAGVIINGVVGGSIGLDKEGGGALILNGANDYSGGTTLGSGVIGIGNDGAFSAGRVTVSAGGGSIFAAGADHSVSNAFVLNGGLTVMDDPAGPQDLTLTGVLSGDGSLTKNGASTLTLTAVETFSGGVTVNGGTLQVGDGVDSASLQGSAGSASLVGPGNPGGTAVTVNNAATLTVLSHATITGGAGGNTLARAGGAGGAAVNFVTGGSFANNGSVTGGAGGTTAAGPGGQGGAAVIFASGGSFTNSGVVTGGAGGTTALGAGGAGGAAVTFTSGGSFTNNGVVTGGAGANTGLGAGGAGGTAVTFGNGGSLTNSGVITGGASGTSLAGNTGASGMGVTFANATGTLVNSSGGVITGGVSMDDFANSVTLETGSTINGALNIGSSAAATLTLTGSGTQTYSSAVTGATTFSGSLIKDGAGAWTLDQTFDYSGSTTILNGTLQLGVSNALPSTTDLILGTTNSAVTGQLDLSGANQTVNSVALAAANTGGAGNSITSSNGPATLTVSSTTTNSVFGGLISGPLSLVKDGAGTTLTLTAANTYTGSTSLNGGALLVNNATGSATGSGPVTVNSGGTLGGSGAIAGAVTLNAGGVIAPGAGSPGVAGTTLRAGSLTWNGGGALSLQVGATSDLLALTGALTKSTATPGSYTVNITNAGITQTSYTLASFASTNFVVGDFTLALPTGYSAALVETPTSLDLALSYAATGSIIQNSNPINTPVIADFTVAGPVTTGAPTENNTINSLIFTPGGTLTIFNTLTLTSGNVTTGAGANTITGGTLFGPNGLQFNVAGSLFLEGRAVGNATLTGGGELYLDGALIGNLEVIRSVLGGDGSISGNLLNSGTVSPGHSPGTLQIGGNYTQSSAGLLKIEIGGRAPGQFDLLQVGGKASLGGALQLVSLNGFSLGRGDKITFLTAGQGVDGNFTSVINSFVTGTILQPTVVYSLDSVELEAIQGSFEKLAKTDRLPPNDVSVGRALDRAVSDSRANALINYLDDRPLGKLPRDFERIDPEQLTSMYTIGISLAQVQSLNIQRRAEDIRSGSSGFSAERFAMNGASPGYSGSLDPANGAAGAAGPDGKAGIDAKDVKDVKDAKDEGEATPNSPFNRRWGVFLSGTGDWVNVGDTDSARGYNIESGGFTVGVDYKVHDYLAVGLSLGYTGATADLTDRGRIWVNGGKVGIYTTSFADGLYVDTAVNGGYNSYDTRRSALDGEARASAEGGEFNGLVGTGYDFKKGALTFGPTATFNYTYLGLDGFAEHGSLAPLDVHGGDEESLRTALGFKVNYEWKIGKVLIKPELRAAWQHEFGDTTYTLDSSFANGAGGVFTVDGPRIGRDSALLSGGFAIQCSERCSTYLFYDGVLGCANYHSSSVSGGLRLEY